MQLFEASYNINSMEDPRNQMMSDFSDSLVDMGKKQSDTKNLAASKLNELIDGYGNGDIIAW